MTVLGCKAENTTGDFVLQATLTRKSFGGIPNLLMYRGKMMRSWWKAVVPTAGYVVLWDTCRKCVPAKKQCLSLARQQQQRKQ